MVHRRFFMAINKSSDNFKFEFEGFYLPTTTPVPDQVFDTLLFHLTDGELRVLLYIIRRTFGFKKETDNISLSQIVRGIRTKEGKVLDLGAGISKPTATKAVRGLVQKGVITATRRRSAERGDEATTYSLRFKPTPVLKNFTRGGKAALHGGVNGFNTQQTVLQETEEQHDVVVRKALQNFGISKSAADKLANSFPEELILEKLDLAQWLVSTGSPTVAKNPAGWLRKAIEEDYSPPKNYESPKQKKEKSARATQIAQREAKERSIAEAEYRRVRAESRERLLQEFPPEPVGEGLTTHTAWELVLNNLKDQVGVASYETWLKDTVLLEVTGQAARIAVGTPHKIAWVERRLYQPIASALKYVLKRDVDLQFVASPLNTE
jgi:hypothetical protein